MSRKVFFIGCLILCVSCAKRPVECDETELNLQSEKLRVVQKDIKKSKEELKALLLEIQSKKEELDLDTHFIQEQLSNLENPGQKNGEDSGILIQKEGQQDSVTCGGN